jgi:enoyl-CoA hydratase/carnithine racemase
MNKLAVLEKQEGVAIITMDDPSNANANSTSRIIDELTAAVDDVNADPDIGAVIFTGARNVFSSGGEIALMESYQPMDPIDVRAFYQHKGIHKFYRQLHHLELPTIAAVNGPAYGSGFGMALMCDIRLASTNASFTMNFAKLGILPGDGGAMLLLRAVGHQEAAKIMFTARPVNAERAKSLGIVSDLYEPDKLMPAAMELANAIAAHPTRNMRLMKRVLKHAHTTEWEAFVDLTTSMQALSHHTQEHRDGLQQLRESVAQRRHQGRQS